MKIVLASKSASRRALLTGAGLTYEAVGADVDEAEIKSKELRTGATPAEIALTLAIAKAKAACSPGALTIGGDQVLEFEGVLYDKPTSVDEARTRLLAMAGKPHFLRSGLALFRGQNLIWTHKETSTLWFRDFTAQDVDDYFQDVGDRVLATVGAYELEGPGVRLFERTEGDYFSILGLPLLPLLDALRREGALKW